MKKLSVLMFLLATLLAISQAEAAGFLQAKDARVVDAEGREVILRGMGLGGWMLWTTLAGAADLVVAGRAARPVGPG